MNAKTVLIAGCLVILSVTAGQAFLGPRDDLPRDRRERVLERIEMMRMWKMTEDLDLTEEEGSILFPFLREIDEDRRRLDQERNEVIRELRATLRGENPDHVAIEGLLDRLEVVRKRTRDLEDREYEKIGDVLNPEQVARYLIFKREFDHEIREVIFRARRDGPPVENPERREPPPPEEELRR